MLSRCKTALRTFMAASVTSVPIPSPAITPRLIVDMENRYFFFAGVEPAVGNRPRVMGAGQRHIVTYPHLMIVMRDNPLSGILALQRNRNQQVSPKKTSCGALYLWPQWGVVPPWPAAP